VSHPHACALVAAATATDINGKRVAHHEGDKLTDTIRSQYIMPVHDDNKQLFMRIVERATRAPYGATVATIAVRGQKPIED